MRKRVPDDRTDDVRFLAMVLAVAWCWSAFSFVTRPVSPPPVRFDAHTVDLNRAPAAELRCLPGVGRVLAARIVEERGRGRFGTPADLERVHGIGSALVERVRPFVACPPPGEGSAKRP